MCVWGGGGGSVSSCFSAYNYTAVSQEEGNTLTPTETSERLLDRLQGNFDNRYPCVLWRMDPDMFADPPDLSSGGAEY